MNIIFYYGGNNILMDNLIRCRMFEVNSLYSDDDVYYMIRQVENKVLGIINKKTV